jgi:hypothetical protein
LVVVSSPTTTLALAAIGAAAQSTNEATSVSAARAARQDIARH